MSHIGILGESYPLFDWTTSNGSASAEQTRRGWNALTQQGLCQEFSRLVWNDIVQTAADALANLGKGWDDGLCAVSEAKISHPLGELTARQWNSVTANVARLMPLVWAWETDTFRPGYLGRRQMLGVSEAGEEADLLFGWYVTELVEALNMGIRLWRGEGLHAGLGSGCPVSSRARTALALWLKKQAAAQCPISSRSRSALDAILFPHVTAGAKGTSLTAGQGKVMPGKHMDSAGASASRQESRGQLMDVIEACFRGCVNVPSEHRVSLIRILLMGLRKRFASLSRGVSFAPPAVFARGARLAPMVAHCNALAANVGFCVNQTAHPGRYTGHSVTHVPLFIRGQDCLPCSYTGGALALPPVFVRGSRCVSAARKGTGTTVEPLFSAAAYAMPPVRQVHTGAELGTPLFTGAVSLAATRVTQRLHPIPNPEAQGAGVCHSRAESQPVVAGSLRMNAGAVEFSAACGSVQKRQAPLLAGACPCPVMGTGGARTASAGYAKTGSAVEVRSVGRLLLRKDRPWLETAQTGARLSVPQTHSAKQSQHVLEVY